MEVKPASIPPFIEVKVRTWYRLHNKKRNGFMSRSDFSEMAESFVMEFNLDPKTSDEIRSWLVDGWSELLKYIKSNSSGDHPLVTTEQIPTILEVADKLSKDGKITEDMYVKAYAESLQINPSPFPMCFTQMVSLFFKVFDTDNDGFVTEKDLIRGWKCFGITSSKPVKAVFAELDKSGSGKIDCDTYVNAWMEFMTGTDPQAPMGRHLKPDIL